MTASNPTPSCASCRARACVKGKDCFDASERHLEMYEEGSLRRLMEAASEAGSFSPGHETRLREIADFARAMGCAKIGLAFCVGLSEEAKTVESIYAKEFEVISVCCKVCGIPEEHLIPPPPGASNGRTAMCNPAGQADLLNRAKTELNVVVGLCVGHDAIFSMMSDAPTTTLIVKDRALAHNPAGAVYSRYARRHAERRRGKEGEK